MRCAAAERRRAACRRAKVVGLIDEVSAQTAEYAHSEFKGVCGLRSQCGGDQERDQDADETTRDHRKYQANPRVPPAWNSKAVLNVIWFVVRS